MRKEKAAVLLSVCLCSLSFFSVQAAQPWDLDTLLVQYELYEESFAAIKNRGDVEKNGFEAVEEQSFQVILESFGEEEVTFLPIMDESYNRLALLILDGMGEVLYKTNQLETNQLYRGELWQPTKSVVSVAFKDLNRDGLTDIVLITDCENDRGAYAGQAYRIGDVLFQEEQSFYRDWRISDKINRYGMNKGAELIVSYVRDGSSTEALYTATTLQELLDSGFLVAEEQCYYRSFEKQGLLQVVPGTMRIASFDIFMIYLVNQQGYIVWSFQPMGDYNSLYALKGMACRDLDGDGMKDLVVLARYSYEGEEGELLTDTCCDIYYQRTDGFEEDTQFEKIHQCTEEDTVGELVELIREYWGWTKEE